MIPSIEILTEEIKEPQYPDRTYQIKHGVDDAQHEVIDRISGYAEEIKALQQAIYLILMTERYEHIIYSWDYGVELFDLIGQPVSYCIAEIPRRITEALLQDDRIIDVIDFEFEVGKNNLLTTFTVVSIYGNIDEELGVEI